MTLVSSHEQGSVTFVGSRICIGEVHDQKTDDIRGTNHGASLVYLHSETLNFLVEYVRNENQAVQADGSKAWEKSAFLNPGLRHATNYASGWQMVSGVSFPIGVGPSRKDNGILFYLSFEK